MLPDVIISTLFFFNSKSVTIFVSMLCTEALFTRTIPDVAFAPGRNRYRIGPLFTHKNGDFGAIL